MNTTAANKHDHNNNNNNRNDNDKNRFRMVSRKSTNIYSKADHIVYGNNLDAFKQQKLSACYPILSPVCVILLLLFVFMFFLPIGILLEECSAGIVSESVRYDNEPGCAVTSSMNATQLPVSCTVNVTVRAHMRAPIFVYYELRNFYQNQRQYIVSKSNVQLRGEGNDESYRCFPLERHQNPRSAGNHHKKAIVPCGLIANSVFNDRLTATVLRSRANTDEVLSLDLCENCVDYGANASELWYEFWDDWHAPGTWDGRDIAWPTDAQSMFVYDEKLMRDAHHNTRYGIRQERIGLPLPDVDNEDFMVWMRINALPHFRKLYRVIRDINLIKDDVIQVRILNWFPVSEFEGEKWVTFAHSEWCGTYATQQYVLGMTFIVVGCVAFCLVMVFGGLLLFTKSRAMADVHYFEWHNLPRSRKHSFQEVVSMTR